MERLSTGSIMSGLTIIAVLLAVAITIGIAAPAGKAPETIPALGQSLATVSLFDLSGTRYAMEDVKEPCVVVICWAFWCDTWKKALPEIIELHNERNDLGCAIWTVSIDGRYTEEIRAQVAAKKIPVPVLLDDGTVSGKLGIRRVPTVMLLDENRQVTAVYEGYPGNKVLVQALRERRKGETVVKK
ncbi:MAG: TlpA family protein disulfide reductase [Armatimonadota bacterium]